MLNSPEESKRMIGPLKIDLQHDNSLDESGQPNIIDYTNHEPMLTSMDERGVGGPGTILLNNEPTSRSPKPIDGFREGEQFDNSTGDLAPGARKSNPSLPTGIPLSGPNYLPTENMEAFVEEEHPRIPEGTSTGGQFVSKDGGSYPTGSSKEEKTARTKFFEPHKQTNLEIGELTHELSIVTLDRNIAKVQLKRAFDRKEDTNDLYQKYDELARKVDKIKSDRDAKLKDLTNKKGLEGLEVQKALYIAKKEKEEAAKHKPGSKIEMKHLMDSMAMEFRVDLIRRGKVPDKDFYGNNPYQSDIPKEVKPKQEISKSFTTATKDHIQDFKHSAKVKLVGNVDTAHLDEVKKLWNNLSPEEAAGVENLVIKGSSSGQRKITVGEWVEKSKTLNVITHDRLTQKDYAETINHEIGHKEYVTKTPEQIEKWRDAVKDILPPTEYTKFHRDRARKYENSWRNTSRYKNADEAERKIIDGNIKVFSNLYHEEIHSEVVSHMRTGGIKENRIYSKSGIESAVKFYQEIFG